MPKIDKNVKQMGICYIVGLDVNWSNALEDHLVISTKIKFVPF
jgi:hypothetical protein